MPAFSSSTHSRSDTGSPPANGEPYRRRQPTSRHPTPTARTNNRRCPWYYRSPILNTVYMKPIYTHCYPEGFLGGTPRFCAAELSINTSNQTFSLLPIPADASNATAEYCKIEFWESHLYKTKQSGIRWEQLNEGISIRYWVPEVNPLTRRPAAMCPAPYLAVVGNIEFSYRRHPGLYLHVPGDFHGYGDFDRSFHERTWSVLDRSSTTYYKVGKANTSVALTVILVSIFLIATYLQKHIRYWSGNSESPECTDQGSTLMY